MTIMYTITYGYMTIMLQALPRAAAAAAAADPRRRRHLQPRATHIEYTIITLGETYQQIIVTYNYGHI